MRIIDVPERLAADIIAALQDFDSIASQLKRMNKRLDRIEGHEEQEAIDLAALTAKVEASTTLDESIKTLVETLADELADQPGMAEVSARLKTSGDALLAAVRANTNV